MKSVNPVKYVIQSMSDIVKAHGREIKVESKKGDGTNFKIKLPV